jgi:hypothetical protein
MVLVCRHSVVSSACYCERELGGVMYFREEGGDGDNKRG